LRTVCCLQHSYCVMVLWQEHRREILRTCNLKSSRILKFAYFLKLGNGLQMSWVYIWVCSLAYSGVYIWVYN
jgi:hypothetical protein